MMEQLAERRMQREEEAQFRYQSTQGHNHGPPLDDPDEYDEDEDEDDDYSQEDDEYEEEDEMVKLRLIGNESLKLIANRKP